MAGTIPVMRLDQYIAGYHSHPEAKAADQFGNPAGPDKTGLLSRLRIRSKALSRIGKEVDRLKGDEGASLDADLPVEYERDDLAEDLDFLARLPQEATARDLGLSVRGWRNLLKGISHPRNETAERIRQLTTDYRGQGRCG